MSLYTVYKTSAEYRPNLITKKSKLNQEFLANSNIFLLTIRKGNYGIHCGSGEAGICGAAIACVIYAIVKRLIYIYHFPPNKGKKVKEQRLSLQGLEYTLVEIYRIIKRRLDYPDLKTIDMEESRICIYCKYSKQYLSLDCGELILQREKDDTSTASLIDMECLTAAIAECLGLPVEKGSKELLSQRKYDKWSYKIIFALLVIMIIMMALSDSSSPVNRVKILLFPS